MRRVDRTRLERRRRLALAAGLAFAIGALTAGTLTWHLDQMAAERAIAAAVRGDDEDLETRAPTGPRTPSTAGATATSGSHSSSDVIQTLRSRHLEMPVTGISRDQLRDTFNETRGGIRRHEALDIMAARGTPVRAVEDGRVAKLFSSVAGGLTVYLFDPTETFAYYYAHLDRYRDGLREGQMVQRGELIGYVGSTGNASEDAPHLHFAIFRLTPERKWWEGDPINPFPILR